MIVFILGRWWLDGSFRFNFGLIRTNLNLLLKPFNNFPVIQKLREMANSLMGVIWCSSPYM